LLLALVARSEVVAASSIGIGPRAARELNRAALLRVRWL